ncbi:Transcriptional regulator PadR-like family protein [Nocardia amikacinitolerans]|uniref:PadR family transcriptional regulator n=1 Tax=Nocardia amikacinitolerans TaxID=756689 RepID=UPI00082F727E|nr:PadR family transcriptional regulator [Nocardia amikacinitolerans]MCP2316223.1 Transcriptional regulator PadR-like family protein [Nocardia amikacinitolerans]
MGQVRPALTALAVAVLALLEERPMHPYEMYQLLLRRGEDLLVKLRPGSLYHTVARLADQELVRAECVDRAGNRPERTTYRITTSGREALRARLTEILRYPAPEYPLFPVALAEAHNLPKDDVLTLVRERVAHLRNDLADLDTMADWARTHEVERRYWIVLPYLRATLSAELTWLTGFLDELACGALEWEKFDARTGARLAGSEHPWADNPPERPPVPRRSAGATS